MSVLTLHDWKLPPLDVRNISILLTLQSQTAAGKMPRFFFIPKSRCLRGKTVFGSGASSYTQREAVNSWRRAQQVAPKVTLSLLSPQHARQIARLHFLSFIQKHPPKCRYEQLVVLK